MLEITYTAIVLELRVVIGADLVHLSHGFRGPVRVEVHRATETARLEPVLLNGGSGVL